MASRGLYIVVEGSDGIGKTTQTRDLLVPYLNQTGIKTIYAHEPGGTDMSEALEIIIKNRQLERQPLTNLLLFTAARLEGWNKLIKPALEQGTWVVADRSWLSSLVYQGYAEGLGADKVYQITKSSLPDEYIYPNITILAEASTEQQLRLLKRRGKSHEDYFESQRNSFQASLRQGYDRLADEPLIRSESQQEKFIKLSFDGDLETVQARLKQAIANLNPNGS